MHMTSSLRAFSRVLGTAAVALALTACGSNVQLDSNVPVSDRTGTSVGAAGAGAGAGADARAVAPVDTQGSQLGQAPAGLATLVYFDFDDYTIRPEFMQVVEGHARFLNACLLYTSPSPRD